MKAISVLQPWASLIAVGAKRYETRSWATQHRGPIAIHASQALKVWQRDFFEVSTAVIDALWYDRLKPEKLPHYAHWTELPLGKIVAIAILTDCVASTGQCPADGRPTEHAFGDFTLGRWLWKLDEVKPITPTHAGGALGLWEWGEPS